MHSDTCEHPPHTHTPNTHTHQSALMLLTSTLHVRETGKSKQGRHWALQRQAFCLLRSEFLWVVQLYRLHGIFPDANALITLLLIHYHPSPLAMETLSSGSELCFCSLSQGLGSQRRLMVVIWQSRAEAQGGIFESPMGTRYSQSVWNCG